MITSGCAVKEEGILTFGIAPTLETVEPESATKGAPCASVAEIVGEELIAPALIVAPITAFVTEVLTA